MAPSWYSQGRDRARSALGLDEEHTVRNIALGATAAAPFAGLIGRGPIQITPESGPRFSSLKSLEHHATCI